MPTLAEQSLNTKETNQSAGAAIRRRPLRIAVVGSRGIPSAYSGVERACESLYLRLAERGHHVTCYCRPEYAPDGPHMYRGVTLRPTRAITTQALDNLSSTFVALGHALRAGNFDLVHFHAIPAGFFAPLARLRGFPVISTIQGLDWRRAKWKGIGSVVIKQAERFLVHEARRMIVVSRELQAYYRAQYGRITSYVPNGVELVQPAMYADDTVLRTFELQPREYLLYLARLVPEKRTHDLIQAFAQVRTDKKLIIAGDSSPTSSYVAELKRLAASDSRIMFIGFQRGDAVHTLFHNASGYVLPSELEGLPLSLLEAMSHGTTPIVSDIGPHRELLSPISGYNLFFKPHDVSGLADCLHRLLAAPDHYNALGRRIRQFVEQNFSWNAITDLTEDLYYDAIENGPDRAFDLSLGGRA